MANIPLQYPFPYKTTNNTGFTSSVEFNTVTVLGDVTIDQNLTVAGNITTTDLTVGDDLTVGGTIDAQALRAFGIWDSPTVTVTGAGAWIGFDTTGHTIFANRKSTAGQTNSFRWYAYDEANSFQGELMRLSNAGNLFISGTRIEFPLIHFQQPPGTYPTYDFILPSSMGGAGQVLTSAGVGLPTYWTTPSGGGGTVTNVTGTSPVTVTSPSTTPNISLTTIPTTLGGTGLTTVGTNGQVLTSNGTTLSWQTPSAPGTGTVTSVSATVPAWLSVTVTNPTTTPAITITGSSTGTGTVSVLQDSPTINNTLTVSTGGTANIAQISFVRNGDYVHGLGYKQNSSAFGFGQGVTANFQPNFLCIDPGSSRVGIYNINPEYTFDVSSINTAFRNGYGAGLLIDWNNIAPGSGATDFWNYRGGGGGGFKFKNRDTSNNDVGWSSIECGSGWFNGQIDINSNGELLQLNGTNTSFVDYNIGGTLGFRTGFFYNGDPAFYFTQKRNGPIEFYHDGTSGQVTNFYMPITTRDYINITKPGTGVTAEINISAGTVGSPSVANQATLNFGTVGGGGGTVWSTIKSKYSAAYGYHHEHSSDNLVSLSPIIIDDAGQRLRFICDTTSGINYIQSGSSSTMGSTADLSFGPNQVSTSYLMIKAAGNVGIGTTTPTEKLHVVGPILGENNVKILSNSNPTDCQSMLSSNAGNSGLELRAINGTAYIDMTAKTPSPGIDYDFRIAKTNTNDVNFYNAHSGSFVFDRTVRAPNFTTNGLQTFTYASGTFTPRIAMFYTIDGKVYECNAAPAGRDNIAITYTVQTGVWVRMGNTMMINMEIQYNQTYSGIFFNLSDLNIVAVIPEAACNPSTLGVVGVTGYPSRIRDRFVDNFQMNYWISNTAYAPGGTICEVQLRRDNTHNMCPWDPTNKTGERVNITASYYVSQ